MIKEFILMILFKLNPPLVDTKSIQITINGYMKIESIEKIIVKDQIEQLLHP